MFLFLRAFFNPSRRNVMAYRSAKLRAERQARRKAFMRARLVR